MTVLPVLLAAKELCEKYQGGELTRGEKGLDWSTETSLGGAEAGRGGGGGEVNLPALKEDLRLREGGESRAEFMIGVVGGVLRGVVGVAGWSVMARFG